MSRRRKARPGKRQKRSDRPRRCPSGKRGWRHQGDADAFLRARPNSNLTTYRCRDCGEWHLGNKTSRTARRRRAEQGKPINDPHARRKEPDMGLLNKSRDEQPEPEERQGPAPLAVDLDPRQLPEFEEVAAAIARANRDADRLEGDITTPEQASEATDALKFLGDAIKDAEAARKKVKRPFDDAGKRVQSAFVEVQSPAKARKRSLEERIVAFERARERERREQREAEEAAARKREAEANAAGEEEEAKRAREDVDRAMAPRAEVSGARGASGAKASPTDELKYEIVDESLLPDEYVNRVPNRGRILEGVRQGIAIPGVRTYREDKVRVR